MVKLIALVLTAVSLNAGTHGRQEAEKLAREIRTLRLKTAVKLAEARAKGYTCEVDAAAPSEIIRELHAATIGGRELRDAVAKFTVLNVVLKNNLTFRKFLADLDYTSPTREQLEALLKGAVFFSPPQGAYGSSTNITFRGGGVLEIRQRLDSETFKWETSVGSYELIEAGGPRGPKTFNIRADLGARLGKKLLILKSNDEQTQDWLVPEGESEYDAYSTEVVECDA